MKRPIICLILAAVILLLTGCGASTNSVSEQYPQFTYTHYSSGGTAEEYQAVILFEESTSTFTAYQVAFSSCTCRDSLVNYLSVCYVEILNTKPSADLAAIRSISFGNNTGLYGDSNPNYYRHDYTEEYMNENFIQRLVKVTKGEFDAWQGYGTQLDAVDADAISGATVTSGNVTSILRSLMQYHAEKYYSTK